MAENAKIMIIAGKQTAYWPTPFLHQKNGAFICF